MNLFLGILFFLPQLLYSEEDGVQCHIDEDGNQVCTPQEEEEIDYEFMLHGEKTYDCENENKSGRQCDRWADAGECDRNVGYMIINCPRSCGYCHLIDPAIRCKRHPYAVPAVSKAGEIDAMFERIMTDPNFEQYTPIAHSRDPWLVELHNVVTPEEAERLIELGGVNFRRSVDAGKMEGNAAQFEEIVSDARTSYTDWCTHSRGCWDDSLVQSIANKAENITLIPKENSEFFQVLRYEVGQYYVQHHDYIPGHLDLPIGPRLYTFFLYLGKPEEGGGTRFPRLNVTVEPEVGKVAIWPSVLNSNPLKKDPRTLHEALPVEKGIKYGANMWLHMYNFHGPYKLMCTG